MERYDGSPVGADAEPHVLLAAQIWRTANFSLCYIMASHDMTLQDVPQKETKTNVNHCWPDTTTASLAGTQL